MSKATFLEKNLVCLDCAGKLSREGRNWLCRKCDRLYPMIGGAISFIDQDLATKAKIVESENVSDHAYNPSALKIIEAARLSGGSVLDCGSGSRTFVAEHVVQVEIVPYPNVDILAINQSLPFCDNAFDAVFSFDVLEHVTDPFQSARELVRVLRPGGLLYVDLPFMQVEHGYPHHYFNATRMGLRQLFAGLVDIRAHFVPLSGHASHALLATLNVFRSGLPGDLRQSFDAMTVGELVALGHKGLRDCEFGRSLNEAAIWKMASTTSAFMTKTGVSEAQLDIDIGALPHLRDPRIPFFVADEAAGSPP